MTRTDCFLPLLTLLLRAQVPASPVMHQLVDPISSTDTKVQSKVSDDQQNPLSHTVRQKPRSQTSTSNGLKSALLLSIPNQSSPPVSLCEISRKSHKRTVRSHSTSPPPARSRKPISRGRPEHLRVNLSWLMGTKRRAGKFRLPCWKSIRDSSPNTQSSRRRRG